MRACGWSALLFVLAAPMLLSSCTSSNDPSETLAASSTTTITVDLEPATGAAVTFSEGVGGDRRDELTDWVAGLRGATEVVRGLRFLDEPQIRFVTDTELAGLWERRQEELLDPTELAGQTRFLQLLGVLARGQSLRALLEPAFDAPPDAFFDGQTGEIVIAVPAEDTASTATFEQNVVGATVAALTDQYHQHTARLASLVADGMHDEADAMRALVAADAAYFSLVFAQELAAESPPTAVVVPLAPATPAAIGEILAFPYDEALEFVQAQVADGGIAAVDAAYATERLTTEQMLHPVRFGTVDPIVDVGQSPLVLTGYQLHSTGTLGELGLRSLLAAAQEPGLTRQIAEGWGGDRFTMFTSGNDVAWVYLYRGDDVDHALEVAQSFLNLAENAMEMNEPVAAGGGVEFIGRAGEEPIEGSQGGPYVYVDRVGASLVVVVADEVDAGRKLRSAVEAS